MAADYIMIFLGLGSGVATRRPAPEELVGKDFTLTGKARPAGRNVLMPNIRVGQPGNQNTIERSVTSGRLEDRAGAASRCWNTPSVADFSRH